MKVIRLLHQYLKKISHRQSKRRSLARMRSIAEVSVSSLDVALETRILLSATGCGDAATTSLNVEPIEFESAGQFVGLSVEAINSELSHPVSAIVPIAMAMNDEAAVALNFDSDDASRFDIESARDALQHDQFAADDRVFESIPPGDAWAADGSIVRRTPSVVVPSADASAGAIGSGETAAVTDLVNIRPLPQIEQRPTVLPKPLTEVHANPKAVTLVDRVEPKAVAPHDSAATEASQATHESPALFPPDGDGSIATAKEVHGELYSAKAASPKKDVGSWGRLSASRLRHIRPRWKSSGGSDSAVLTLQVNVSSTSMHVETFLVAASSASKVSGDPLSAIIQSDTTNRMPEGGEDLSDWLQRQLLMDSQLESTERGNIDAAPDVYVAPSDQRNIEQDNEPSQQSFTRLERLASDGIVVLLLSDSPPEPAEIAGIWQRLKFDYNPRGPPISDSNSAFQFTHQDAKANQLARLRHSITPRGPSVASTF